MKRILSVVLCLILTCSLSAADTRTWTGRWNNRKYGTSCPLKCVAVLTPSGGWQAVFNGTFKGDPFEYRVEFTSRAKSGREALTGTATISGHPYQWQGSLDARQLKGNYKSTNGNNGTFMLQESKTGARPTPPTISEPAGEAKFKPGDNLLFIGNRFMASEGGIFNYLQKAVGVGTGMTVQTDSIIDNDRPLSAMLTAKVGRAIVAVEVDSVVITSGELTTMRKFITEIEKAGKHPIVFMTWEPRHPGNRGTDSYYTTATKTSVRNIRRLQKETGATIIPVAVVYHELTTRPPQGMPRRDFLWRPANIHQNELGTMVNAWMMYTILTGKSPVGVDFDMPPFVAGETLQSDPDLKLTAARRLELQTRVWEVAKAWNAGRTHLE
jgi:hypothetical protein